MESKFRRNLTSKSTYDCVCCGRTTRETGLGEEGSQCCAFCFEAAGIDNSLSDGHITKDEARNEYARLVKSYGKRAHVDCLSFAEVVAEPEHKETKNQAKARRARARRAARKAQA